MKINKEIANGIIVSGSGFEYAIAVRKPNLACERETPHPFMGGMRANRKT